MTEQQNRDLEVEYEAGKAERTHTPAAVDAPYVGTWQDKYGVALSDDFVGTRQ